MTIVEFADLLDGCRILGVWMDWELMIKCQCNSPPEIVCGPYAEVWGVWHLKYDCAWIAGASQTENVN
jgi:hypothetical protein